MRFHVPPEAKSWVPVSPESHFPIQNLPMGLACLSEDTESVVTAIGDYVVDLCTLSAEGLLPVDDFPILHSMIDLEREDIGHLRRLLFDLLREDNPVLRDDEDLRKQALIPMEQVQMLVPVEIPQYVDFYSGIHHASNVGKMFRPDQPALLPNYKWVPIAYNGRCSSIVASGAPIRRPKGQVFTSGSEAPEYCPTRELDFELELGFFVGTGSDLGEPIPIEKAECHMLGVVLVNDWSARDVQRWEYQPLGPFLAKSFATSISPWIVSMDALEPFRCNGCQQEPEPLGYLKMPEGSLCHYDLVLEVAIQTERMTKPQVVSRTNSKHLYWTFAQQLAHLTSNGCCIQSGDLCASGTISGPEPGTYGSMLELAWRGTKPLRMDETGEERSYIQDGDTVSMTAYGQGNGYRIGLGTLSNKVVPAA